MSSGGKREGAGRKPKPNKLVQLALYVPPKVKSRIRALSMVEGVTEGEFVARVVDRYYQEEQ